MPQAQCCNAAKLTCETEREKKLQCCNEIARLPRCCNHAAREDPAIHAAGHSISATITRPYGLNVDGGRAREA